MDEMKAHYQYGTHIKNLRQLMELQGRIVLPPMPFVPLFSIATHTPFREIVSQFSYGVPTKPNLQTNIPIGWHPVNGFNARRVIGGLGILEFALYGLAVDYSNVDYLNPSISGCGTQGCSEAIAGDGKPHQIVTLCGKCVDVSDIGNMMFGLGGAARGYNLATTYGSAGAYNVLADWWPSADKNLQTLFASFFDADGRGAIPGHLIGQTYAFFSQGALCGIINRSRAIGYNDVTTLDQVGRCKACTTTHSPTTEQASSLISVSGLRTIDWLKRLTGMR